MGSHVQLCSWEVSHIDTTLEVSHIDTILEVSHIDTTLGMQSCMVSDLRHLGHIINSSSLGREAMERLADPTTTRDNC